MADQTAHARLTAAGCPPQHAAQLQGQITPEQAQALCDLAAVTGSFDWAKLVQLVAQYGPAVVQAILALFGK